MVDEGRGVIEVANPCRRLLVVRAQSLRNADKIGKSDPYAVVYFDNRRVGQTKTMRNTVDPRWDAEFELLDVDKQSVLKIMVYDHDFHTDDFLGEMEISVQPGELFSLREFELSNPKA